MPKAIAPVPDELKETLRWATESLREIYGPRLKRLILFGSWARGDARPDSDVDVLVVLEVPIGLYKEARRTSRVATRAAAYRGTALSFIHLSEEEFSDDRRLLVRSVKKEGVDLLERFSESPSSSDSPSVGSMVEPASGPTSNR